MLHKLFDLQRPLIVLDLETTGVKIGECRIVEIGFQCFDATGMYKEWKGYVNPGIPIPPHVTEVHSITDEMIAESPTFNLLAANLAKGFSNCDFAGKNVRFDLRVLASEMKRVGVEWSYASARIIDAERLEQIGEPRQLKNLYKKYTGNELIDAHSALVDVVATVEVIIAQMSAFPQLSRSLDILHDVQWPGYIDTEGLFKFRDKIPIVSFGKWKDHKMKDVPLNYWKWILGADFSSEIKDIVSKALSGEFPVWKE